MARLALLLWVVLLAATFAGRAHAATYYVSPRGDDARPGTSPDAAWRTLTRVNSAKLQPGDAVLLEGGKTFEGPLVPWSSGLPGAPITFSSYGTGRATIASSVNNIVWFPGVSYVTLDNLRLTSNGADNHVIVSKPDATSAYVTIRNSLITNTGAFGINSPSLSDHDWTIERNTVSQTDETGITFRGSGFRVIGNQILATGLEPGEAAHGVYAKGPRAQVIGNTIVGFRASGVSIRYEGSIVRGNRISGGLIGVSYFQDKEATAGGTSFIAYNRISNVAEAGIFLDDSSLEGFVIASNTIRAIFGNGLNLHRVKSLTLVNNVTTGIFDKYVALIRQPEGAYVEHHNLWFPATGRSFGWNGVERTFADYRAASGQGVSDLLVDPLLDNALVPKAASPVLDAGAVLRSLGYRPACDGQPFSFCGRAPEIGAAERRTKLKPR